MRKTILVLITLFFIFSGNVMAQNEEIALTRPVIEIRNNKTIYVDGRFVIPRVIWNPFVVNNTPLDNLYSDSFVYNRIRDVAARGFNAIAFKISCYSSSDASLCRRVLTQAKKYNTDHNITDPDKKIWVFFTVQKELMDNPNQTGIDNALTSIGNVYNNSQFMGVLLYDEPDDGIHGISHIILQNMTNAIHTRFPGLLTFTDLSLQTSTSVYKNSADIIAHEHHCYLNQHNPCYSNNYLNILANDALRFTAQLQTNGVFTKPAWGFAHMYGNYQNTDGSTSISNPPTPDQLKKIVEAWLNSGVTGIVYYAYEHAKTWLITSNSPDVWPKFDGRYYGSPNLWNSLKEINDMVIEKIKLRDNLSNPITPTLTPPNDV